mgnify:CR=1 FL=1
MNKMLIGLVGMGLLWGAVVEAAEKGSAGGQMLKIGVGARPAAMGEAFCAVDDGVNSINPAGLAQVRKMQFSITHQEWIDDLRHVSISSVYPLLDGVIGANIAYLTMGKLNGRDAVGNETGSFAACDMIVGVTYAKTVRKQLAIGLGLKVLQQRIATEQAIAIMTDMGARLQLNKSLSIGAAIQNLGTKVKFVTESDRLPLSFTIGGAYNTLGDKLLVAVDVNKAVDSNFKVNLGAEYWVTNMLAIRGGYNSSIDAGDGFSAGAGLRIKNCQIDYALVPYGDLGKTHRISFSFR